MANFTISSAATVQRYVDILTNGGFKALFGDVNNKEVVMSILNVLLPEHRKLADIEYLPTERQGQMVDVSKEYHYDFMCRDLSGAVFIVELQRYHEDHWFKRCVSYACRAYDRQTRKGASYDVPPVYLIGLMDVEINHPDRELWTDRFVSEYTFREKECGDLLGETIVIIFAEMANFSKTVDECDTEIDKMLYLLKNIGRMMSQPAWLQHEVYSRIFAACEIAGFTEDKRIEYEKEMYDERRRKSEMDTARRIGFETGHKEGLELGHAEGLAEGHAEGHAEGLAEGRAEGLAEGRAETLSEIARKMLASGMPVEQITRLTGLSVEDINAM